jgi:C4-type Zn-finger protein
MSIGNKYQSVEDSHVGCFVCGTDTGLFQVAHRKPDNYRVVGYVFTCEHCFPQLIGRELMLGQEPA